MKPIHVESLMKIFGMKTELRKMRPKDSALRPAVNLPWFKPWICPGFHLTFPGQTVKTLRAVDGVNNT